MNTTAKKLLLVLLALLLLVWSGVLGTPLSNAVVWLFDKFFAVAKIGFDLSGGLA